MLHGSMVALITPFQGNDIDENALANLVEWHIQEGTQALVPVGTTGESPTLSIAEHERVIKLVAEVAAERVPVIAGAGSNNPSEAIHFAECAQTAGADALLSVAGYYNRPSQEGLYQHFKQLHDRTSLPIIIYNVPPRTIVDITPPTMARLADLPRIVGVKDATMDLSRCGRERALIKKDFCYFSGDDITALAYNAMGGVGCISVAANVVPRLCRQFQDYCAGGDFVAARKLHDRLFELFVALTTEPSPAGIKYAVSLLGFCQENCRLPIIPLQSETKTRIETALKALDVVH